MGADKAMLVLEGMTLLERAIDVVRQVADDVVVVGDRPDYHQFGARVVADAYPDTGTLGGIATALRHAHHDRVLIVACDMPFLSLPLLRAMINEPTDFDVLVPVTPAERSHQGGKQTYETLHAIYARTCLEPIEQCLASGNLKVIGFFDEVRVRTLASEWIARYDPRLSSFMNANTPEELRKVQTMLANGGEQAEGCE
jgi:molybdopterin-guanine dinucleotide biosynthesis protein A